MNYRQGGVDDDISGYRDDQRESKSVGLRRTIYRGADDAAVAISR